MTLEPPQDQPATQAETKQQDNAEMPSTNAAEDPPPIAETMPEERHRHHTNKEADDPMGRPKETTVPDKEKLADKDRPASPARSTDQKRNRSKETKKEGSRTTKVATADAADEEPEEAKRPKQKAHHPTANEDDTAESSTASSAATGSNPSTLGSATDAHHLAQTRLANQQKEFDVATHRAIRELADLEAAILQKKKEQEEATKAAETAKGMANSCDDPYRVNHARKETAQKEYQTALSEQEGLDATTAAKLLQLVGVQEEVDRFLKAKDGANHPEGIPISTDLKTIACPDCDGEGTACNRCHARGHIHVPISWGDEQPATTDTGAKQHQTRSRSVTGQAKANQPKSPAKERDPKPQKKKTAKASQPSKGSTKTRSTTDASKSRANQDEVQTPPEEGRKTTAEEAPTSTTHSNPRDNEDPAAICTTEGAAKVETAEPPAAPARSRWAPRAPGKRDPPPPGETEVSFSSDDSYDSSDVSYSKYDPPVTNVPSPSSMTVPSPSEDRR